MAHIETTCPHCGEQVGFAPGDAVLHDRAEEPTYAFICPACRAVAVKPVDAFAVELLELVGVPRPPVAHPESPPPGPPFTLDDLIAFHELLATDDWLARLRG